MSAEELRKELLKTTKLLADKEKKLKVVQKVLNDDQIERLVNPKSRKPWSAKTLQNSIKLYTRLGSKGYEDIKAEKPYPDVSTLRRHLRGIPCDPGVQYAWIDLLKMKAENFSEDEKNCGIFIDEANINADLSFDTCHGGQQVGKPTLGPKKAKKKKLKIKNMGTTEIKAALIKYKLSPAGGRKILIERLQEHVTTNKLEEDLENFTPGPKIVPEDVDLKSINPSKMKVKELKEILMKCGLITMGLKKDLQKRLQEYIDDNTDSDIGSEAGSIESDVEIDDDLEFVRTNRKRKQSPNMENPEQPPTPLAEAPISLAGEYVYT